MTMNRVFTIALTISSLVSCTFQSTFERFKESMNIYASGRYSIDEESNFKRYSDSFYVADVSYQIATERVSIDIERYYFKRRFMSEISYCFYYLDVDVHTRKIIGWGLNEDYMDDIHVCGFAA